MLLALLGPAIRLFALAVEPGYDPTRWLSAHEPIELRLTAPIDGSVAIVSGVRDLTALFEPLGTTLRSRKHAPPLPHGEQELVVYSVSDAGAWTEIARLPLKVLTPHGFEDDEFKPALDVGNKGEVDQDQFTTRENFLDVSGQGGFTSLIERGALTIRTEANVHGASYANEALRYPTEGSAAPRIDLASYRVELTRGRFTLALGEVAFGSQRQLISEFKSRGLTLTWAATPRLSLSLGAAHGTTIVGWDDVLGVEQNDNRVVSATVGLELLPARPAGARVELSLLDGTIEPRHGFSDAGARSAGRSQGLGLRLLLSDPHQRVTVDSGWTRSRFSPEPDEEVEGGVAVTPLSTADRDAAYVDANVVLLRNRKLHTLPATLSASLSFERIEPLFHSVATATQPDVLHGSVALNGTIGPIALQLATLLSEDNLADIRSLLKTKTRQTSLNVGLPLSALLASKKYAHWLPAVTLGAAHTHQYGAWLPENADYTDSHVPDQISLNAQGAIEWQIHPLRFGFRGTFSDQDNRQPGRTTTDFITESQGLYLGYSPSPRVDLEYEVTREEQENFALATSEHARRHGITVSCRMLGDLALSGNYSRILGNDSADTHEHRASDAFAELSSGVRVWRGARAGKRARVFLRYSDRHVSIFDSLFGLDQATDGWQLTTGVNLNVF